ncbi:hypothetical protein BCR37DRAFT_390953 [Protomyces lactucae-debilis]|uniref:Uncharacterized protein n=1 Tax=Protomyces lactucae-debilis TaxID=2754530 RepID=A0A1Y2FSJ3_PROLT|nr:uncharacterized protein BCR37DRAFT_390953 [Protomyces lactucae-debilis]ORY86156.1 hypothetical protein BCR37DRAFT_390953 [Protomyces lactucae-debilis]
MSDQKPGLVAAHLNYAKGAAEETIGNVTGSQDWQKSGKNDQSAARDDMKAASNASTDPAARQPNGSLAREGGLESKIGSLVGCEGMEQVGEEKKTQAGKWRQQPAISASTFLQWLFLIAALMLVATPQQAPLRSPEHARESARDPLTPSSIIASPYPDLLLSLKDLEPAHKELALRLQRLSPACPASSFWSNDPVTATAYPKAFNFDALLETFPAWLRRHGHQSVSLTCIVFRSTLAPGAMSRSTQQTTAADAQETLLAALYRLDKEAYQEALSHVGGLLKYWFGTTAAAATTSLNKTTIEMRPAEMALSRSRQNLATCLWVSADHARRAATLPAHRQAQALVKQGVYSNWRVERWLLTVNQSGHAFQDLGACH